MTALISTSEAEGLIREHMPAFAPEQRPLDQATGAILRQNILAERDQPPYDRVTMDGIAIRHQAFAGGARSFNIVGMQAAGMDALQLESADACIEVMTGAMLPVSCDTVIAVEQTRRADSHITLADGYIPQRGQFIHRRGSDCQSGEVLIEAGAMLRAPEIAVLAAHGYAAVDVARQPRVAILATGDELVDVNEPVAPWQIRRSNDRALATMLAARALTDVRLQHITDDRTLLQSAIAQQLEQRDVLILSGGVSMGQRDFVPEVLRELGVQRVFHKIAQRPGKPMWFGVGTRGQVVFALPGNPVSAMVCGARYVVPALLDGMGCVARTSQRVHLGTALEQKAALTWFVPVRLGQDAAGVLLGAPLPPATSGDFSALTQTDGFVQLPATQDHFPAGFSAAYYAW